MTLLEDIIILISVAICLLLLLGTLIGVLENIKKWLDN